MNNVNYWLTIDGVEGAKVNGICFAYISSIPDSIRYSCPTKCSKKAFHFYFDFMKILLGDSKINFTLSKTPKGETPEGTEIMWVLNTLKMKKYEMLSYLTFMRYPDEFAWFVDRFYDLGSKIKDRDELMKIFIKVSLSKQYYNSNHSLMYLENETTIDLFKERFKSANKGPHSLFHP